MGRIEKVLERISAAELDGLLLMKDANIRYVSGFTGSESYLLLSAEKKVFITDSRYTEQAKLECPGFEIIQYHSLEETIKEKTWEMGIKKLGFEKDYVTYEVYEKISQVLEETEPVPILGIVEGVRSVKEEREIALVKKAAQIADQAFKVIIELVKPGITEQELEMELEYELKKQGASGPSFPSIVAGGPRSSLPHAVPSSRVIEKGDFVLFDFGACFEGYCSDMTRTVVVGEPSVKQQEIYQIVQKAQESALNAVQPGIKGKDLDMVARKVIEDAGYASFFGHGLGHGVGLEIHEEPSVSVKSEKVLEPGNIITIEPGIYLPDWGGVRIEDTVVVREKGCEILTGFTKELLVV
ncbi:MAG: M24 family metallopeptidase [Bacillota bacterium]